MTTLTFQSLDLNEKLVDQVITLYDISWEQYKQIDAIIGDNKRVRLFYYQGVLEIMSPVGFEHEEVKSTLSLLLEAYMREKEIRFYRCGGFTLESPEEASAIPDESYNIGTKKAVKCGLGGSRQEQLHQEEFPDIVIEVIITSGKLDKKEIYRPMQIPEIWFWRKGEIIIFDLEETGYRQVERSKFLPDLDIAVLKNYLNYSDQYDAVSDLIAAIRQGQL